MLLHDRQIFSFANNMQFKHQSFKNLKSNNGPNFFASHAPESNTIIEHYTFVNLISKLLVFPKIKNGSSHYAGKILKFYVMCFSFHSYKYHGRYMRNIGFSCRHYCSKLLETSCSFIRRTQKLSA